MTCYICIFPATIFQQEGKVAENHVNPYIKSVRSSFVQKKLSQAILLGKEKVLGNFEAKMRTQVDFHRETNQIIISQLVMYENNSGI